MCGERVGAERGRDVPARFRERARAARRSVVSSAERKSEGASAELSSSPSERSRRRARAAARRSRALRVSRSTRLADDRVTPFWRARTERARAERGELSFSPLLPAENDGRTRARARRDRAPAPRTGGTRASRSCAAPRAAPRAARARRGATRPGPRAQPSARDRRARGAEEPCLLSAGGGRGRGLSDPRGRRRGEDESEPPPAGAGGRGGRAAAAAPPATRAAADDVERGAGRDERRARVLGAEQRGLGAGGGARARRQRIPARKPVEARAAPRASPSLRARPLPARHPLFISPRRGHAPGARCRRARRGTRARGSGRSSRRRG